MHVTMKRTPDSDELLAKREMVRKLLETADPDCIKDVCLLLSARSFSQALDAFLQELKASNE